MSYSWLSITNTNFPEVSTANSQGLLAIGGDLSSERILNAYTNGIFPWFNEYDPILWWAPDPRFVLFPEDLIIHKSMRPYFNQKKFDITFNKKFSEVIFQCKSMFRKGQGGTWITKSMEAAYIQLHLSGHAHSVEVWKKDELVGGLYGILIGKVFFGESMFSKVSNASKFGFISWVQHLKKENIQLIDCQQETQHLKSLGAKHISRLKFMELLNLHL